MAALSLGEMHYLDQAVGWLRTLLKENGGKPDADRLFISVYRDAVQKHIGSQADLVLEWFEKVEKTG